METVNIPGGYQQLMPYMILPDARKFIEFMAEVFGATEKMVHMRDEQMIMHGEILVGQSCIMFADSSEQYPPMSTANFIYVANADETYEKAISAGATSIMPPGDQSYGRSCGITDPFGNTWWITSV